MDESEEGDEGCLVKSSHGDVKQAHAKTSPQVLKGKDIHYLISVSLSLPTFPFARFIHVILEIVCVIYVRD